MPGHCLSTPGGPASATIVAIALPDRFDSGTPVLPVIHLARDQRPRSTPHGTRPVAAARSVALKQQQCEPVLRHPHRDAAIAQLRREFDREPLTLIMTSDPDPGLRERLQAQGFTVLDKPLNVAKLRALLARRGG